MESFLSYAGVAGSAVSMLTTLYFWLVRMRKEMPCLRPYLIDKEFFLGNSRDNVRQIGVKVGVIVANYSVLPNAILGARLWVRVKDGWQEVGHLEDGDPSNQPVQTTTAGQHHGVGQGRCRQQLRHAEPVGGSRWHIA